MTILQLKSELKSLIEQETDAQLLEAVKDLLVNTEAQKEQKALDRLAAKSESAIEEGKVYSVDEARERLQAWRKAQ